MSTFGTDGPAELIKSAGLLLAASFTGDIAGTETKQAIQLATSSITQIAVAARTEELRFQMTEGKLGDDLMHAIHELIRWLTVNLPSSELLAQCIRAVGNLVVDHDENRGKALSHGLVPQIIAAIFDSACSSSPSLFVPNSEPPTIESKLPAISGDTASCIKFACGAITNLCHTNSKLIDSCLTNNGAKAMVLALDSNLAASEFDPVTSTFAIRALCMFADLPHAQLALCDACCGPAAIRTGLFAVAQEHVAIVTQVCAFLSMLDVKANQVQLGEAGVVPFLIRCFSVPSDDDAVACAALRALSPLIELAPVQILSALCSLLPPPNIAAEQVSEMQQLALDAIARVAPTPFAEAGLTIENLLPLNRLAGSPIDMFRKNALAILEALAQTERASRLILDSCYELLCNYASQFSSDDQTSTLALGVLRRLSINHALRRELVERGIVPVLMAVLSMPVSEERNTGMFYCVRTLYNLVSCSSDPMLRSLVASRINDLTPLFNLQNSSKAALGLESGRVLAYLALEPPIRHLILSTSSPDATFRALSIFIQMTETNHYVLHAEVCQALTAMIPELAYCDNTRCYQFSTTHCISCNKAYCQSHPACACPGFHSLAGICGLRVGGVQSQEDCGTILTQILNKLVASVPPVDSTDILLSGDELHADRKSVV